VEPGAELEPEWMRSFEHLLRAPHRSRGTVERREDAISG
jgi:hypothetical protein